MLSLVSSDWHPDWETIGVARYSEVAKAVFKTVDCAIEERVDLYIMLGDLADPSSEGGTYKAIRLLIRAAERLHRHKIPMLLIAGNHDVCTDGSGATTLTPLVGVFDNVIVVEKPTVIEMNDRHFVCLPYTPPSHAYDVAKFAKAAPMNGKTMVLGHLSIPGMHPGSETTDMPRGREVAFPFEETKKAAIRLNGHYHKREVFDPKDGGPPIQIPGSLARLGFGEEDNNPSFLMIEH